MSIELKDLKTIKGIDLGNGLRLTESHGAGIFLHFTSESGSQSGELISKGSRGYMWAVELLSKLNKGASK